MNKTAKCPKCHDGWLLPANLPWNKGQVPHLYDAICNNEKCLEVFTWQELNENWNIDIGDFHDTVSDIPRFPYNRNTVLNKFDYSNVEKRVASLLHGLLMDIEPEWSEIEETLWDVPDAYTQMETFPHYDQTYSESVGFGRDGRL